MSARGEAVVREYKAALLELQQTAEERDDDPCMHTCDALNDAAARWAKAVRALRRTFGLGKPPAGYTAATGIEGADE